MLLDIGLPQLDGYQVARRLRQLPQTRHALIIGLTGYGMPADRQRGREAGFDHHLLKPADPAELRKLIESWSRAAAAGRAARWRSEDRRTCTRSSGPELSRRRCLQRRIARDSKATGISPTATIASDGSAASASRSSRAKL